MDGSGANELCSDLAHPFGAPGANVRFAEENVCQHAETRQREVTGDENAGHGTKDVESVEEARLGAD